MSTSTETETFKAPARLQAFVQPTLYDLELRPTLSTFSFDGSVTVHLTLSQETKVLQLHTKELTLSSASLVDAVSGVTATASKIEYGEPVTQIYFSDNLPVGNHKLRMEFAGTINDQMAGFYRSRYTNRKGDADYMASTQFEALDARRCFPCWDEPAKKAEFKLTMTVDSKLDVLSNMPEVSAESAGEGLTKHVFETTPKMSTYLLAFCVGEFDYLETVTEPKDGEAAVTVRVYTPPGRVEDGRFALDAGKRCLELYNEYFKVPFPLPKMDMIAITEFAAGAMENWGLVTYREVDLLIDEATASPQQKRRVAVVVCHELAHQWFGNLVTMEWWDDLWLNEGFASWMETYATDKLYPEYKMWTEFAGSQQSRALTLDSLRSSHPVQVPINYAEEVEQVFDAISYSKGATVVQMIHAVLGAENFQAGLQLYMQRHQYGNTTTQDLWRAWEDVSGQPISSIMNNWTKQMGYPLIRVTNIHEDTGEATRAMALGVGVGGVLGGIAGGVMGGMVGAIASGNKSSVVFDVHQEWFLADGTGGGEDKTWMVPLKLGEELQLFSEKSKSLKFQTSGILKLNTGQRVPIRVLYPEQHYSKLISQVRKMPAVDRVGFLSDTFALCKAGYVKGSVLTDLLSQFGEEDNSTVWECLESIIGSLNRVSGGAYQELAKSVVQRAYERYGWESRPRDSFDTQLTRNIVLRMVAKCCWEDKRGEALARYRTEPPMPASYRKVVYQILLKTASDSGDYLALRDLFNEYKNNALKKEVLLSLGSALSPELRKRTLDWATSGQVKMQDFFYPIASVAGSGASGREFVWKYFKDNYARIQKLVETGSPFLMSSVINCSSGGFATMERAKEIEQFFQQNPVPRSSRKIEQIIEGTKNDARFAAWLKQ